MMKSETLATYDAYVAAALTGLLFGRKLHGPGDVDVIATSAHTFAMRALVRRKQVIESVNE